MPTITEKPPVQVLDVVIMSGGVEKNIEHRYGMTASDAAREAEVRIPFRSKLFVNNKDADRNTVLQPGDIVTIAPRARNGA